ncbi:MAG: ankyrin repeat domain-containing protein [Chlamydiia bacterium]|nr:ankyrin repeat domain-containing protein [Chlamydiia bacterium]
MMTKLHALKPQPLPETSQNSQEVLTPSPMMLQEAIKAGDLTRFCAHWNRQEQTLPNGEIALHYAIRCDQMAIVEKMLEDEEQAKQLLEAVDIHGMTAIDHAVIAKNSKMAVVLIVAKFGSKSRQAIEDALQVGTDGKGASRAVSLIKEISQEYFENNRLNVSEPLLRGLQDVDYLTACLKDGTIKPDALTEQGLNGDRYSPLHIAVKARNPLAVKAMIEAKASVNLQAPQSKVTPLHLAAIEHSRDVMRLLIDAGADINACDCRGATPLHYAMLRQDEINAQLLLEKGADLFKADHRGTSPLLVKVTSLIFSAKGKDELELETLDKWLFASLCLSLVSGYLPNDLQSLALLPAISLNLAQFYSVVKGGGFGRAVVWMAGLQAIKWIPGGKLANAAIYTYSIAKRALKGIETAVNHSNLETWRPLRNIVVHGTNFSSSSLGTLFTLFDTLGLGYNASQDWKKRDEDIDKLLNKYGIHSETTKNVKGDMSGFEALEYVRDFTSKCFRTVEKSMIDTRKEKREYEPVTLLSDLLRWFSGEQQRINREGPFGTANSGTCSGIPLGTCIRRLSIDSTTLSGAEAVLGFSKRSLDANLTVCRELAFSKLKEWKCWMPSSGNALIDDKTGKFVCDAIMNAKARLCP